MGRLDAYVVLHCRQDSRVKLLENRNETSFNLIKSKGYL